MERRLTCINAVHFSMECEIHKVKERLNKRRKCQNTSTAVFYMVTATVFFPFSFFSTIDL